MKFLRPVVASFAFYLLVNCAFAQEAKQPLFSGYPEIITCKTNLFEKALNAKEGQHIVLHVSENFQISGTVVSNVFKYGKMQTVVIRSDKFEGALLLVSKQNLPNQKFSVSGRMMSPRASDGYQIKQNSEGAYVFNKIDASRLLETCAHP